VLQHVLPAQQQIHPATAAVKGAECRAEEGDKIIIFLLKEIISMECCFLDYSLTIRKKERQTERKKERNNMNNLHF
jgi:hypothetical protein